jgi:LCP family protein required for cell wall assembly
MNEDLVTTKGLEARSKPDTKVYVLLSLCCVLLTVATLAACSSTAVPTGVSAVSPTSSPSPTWTALPATPSATPSATASSTETKTPSATPSSTSAVRATATVTPTPSSVATDTAVTPATATWTSTAQPTAVPDTATVTSTPRPTALPGTPTETITPSPTPTLTPTPLFTPTPLPTVASSADVVNILLVGLDSKRNLRAQNTDVIIVASVNKNTKLVSMLSIPRDLWVYIPTYGWNRINVAHRKGYELGYPGAGPALLMRTIEVNMGLPIDHWIRVDFQGFTRVVDELGGVEMTVACPVNLRYRPPDSEEEEEMILEPGVYHMDGATALRYVRTRRGTSDFDRAGRQHQFLKAMWDQLKAPDLILKIPNLWSALTDSYETDLTLGDVLSLAPIALELQPQRIRSRYIGPSQTTGWVTADGWQVLLPDYERIQRTVASLYAPPSASEDQAAEEAARIQVRNGTYRFQLAQIGADQLRWHGLHVVDTGLADNPNYSQTQIIVYKDSPKAVELLMSILNVDSQNVIHQPDPNHPADIQVILGNDYDPCR